MPALFERLEDLAMGFGFRRCDATGDAPAHIHIDHRRAPDFATAAGASTLFSR
jgi:hypothetical protein